MKKERSTRLEVHIDQETQARAEEVLAETGLTIDKAVNFMLERVVCEGRLPFQLRTPNAETAFAMSEAEDMTMQDRASFANAEDLIADLNSHTENP